MADLRLFHERQLSRPISLSKLDVDECFTAVGMVEGVWFSTTEPIGDGQVLSYDVAESVVLGHEVTEPGDADRLFVVPWETARLLQETSRT